MKNKKTSLNSLIVLRVSYCRRQEVSTYAYVNPVVAVLLGVFFAEEKISLLQVSGLVIILTSVLLINLAKYRSTKKAQSII